MIVYRFICNVKQCVILSERVQILAIAGGNRTLVTRESKDPPSFKKAEKEWILRLRRLAAASLRMTNSLRLLR